MMLSPDEMTLRNEKLRAFTSTLLIFETRGILFGAIFLGLFAAAGFLPSAGYSAILYGRENAFRREHLDVVCAGPAFMMAVAVLVLREFLRENRESVSQMRRLLFEGSLKEADDYRLCEEQLEKVFESDQLHRFRWPYVLAFLWTIALIPLGERYTGYWLGAAGNAHKRSAPSGFDAVVTAFVIQYGKLLFAIHAGLAAAVVLGVTIWWIGRRRRTRNDQGSREAPVARVVARGDSDLSH